MSLITDKFKQVASDRSIGFKDQVLNRPIKTKDGKEIEQKQAVFQTGMQLNDEKVIPCSVIIHDAASDRVNYQITYNRIGYVSDRNKMPQILEKLNELNTVRSGYYHFAVNQDGELHMRNLGITGEDVRPLVDTFVYGGRILRALFPDLQKISGLDLSQRDN